MVGGIYTTTAAVRHCERMSAARVMLAGESALEQTMSLMPDERLAPQFLPESLGECVLLDSFTLSDHLPSTTSTIPKLCLIICAQPSALERTMSLVPDEGLAPQSLAESLGECVIHDSPSSSRAPI